MRLLVGLVLGAAGIAVASRALRNRGELSGLGCARRGIDGSPFYVECVFDQKMYEALLIGRSRKDTQEQHELKARLGATKCTWGCVDDREIQVARFRKRDSPEEYALLARSPKPGVNWQMSWFDAMGPYGDSPRETQCDAVRELSSGWQHHGRVMMVEGQVMSNWYLEEWIG